MNAKPTIRALVVFLRPEEGGRSSGVHASPGYRPHLVVGEMSQRVAVIVGNVGSETYLGVEFSGDERVLLPGIEHAVTLTLLYDGVDYGQLVPGATFTIREGPHVVGFGRVTAGAAPMF